ncbi:uncharacterized protein LOC130795485 [Actinidia eriantha]|uniref:uncharacterized protein LOC130795485 n=1 Tax=Actinidia eriantha TaxID=165200 RepID=UPI00258EC28F|nr:uncharacterized protein LOC130795485 [Actinidia eriantha]
MARRNLSTEAKSKRVEEQVSQQYFVIILVSSMEEKKMKRRQSLWVCCSMIEIKSNKNKNKNKNKKGSADNTHITNTARREEIFSAIFGQKSKRSTICLCCSMIEASPSSPVSPHQGQNDLYNEGDALTMVMEPTTKDVKN